MSRLLRRLKLFGLWFGVVGSAGLNAMSIDATPKTEEVPAKPPAAILDVSEGPLMSFGHWLFDGRFSDAGFVGFSPDYVITSGDTIQVELWGAYDLQVEAIVDASGKIFLPSVGPVLVRGVSNSKLQQTISHAISKVYNANVNVYARLAEAVPVKVYVTGYVDKPGLYAGHSSDSVLRFLDLAGGVDAVAGSYRNISLKRNGEVVSHYDLYDFLLNGSIARSQLRDGDVLVVGAAGARVAIEGDVDRAYLYELFSDKQLLDELLAIAKPSGGATHFRVNKSVEGMKSTAYFDLDSAQSVELSNGDQIVVLEDNERLFFSVRVEGEHGGERELTVKRGATLADVMELIIPTEWSMVGGVQLFRESVKDRQKAMIESSLSAIESSVLMARSNTTDEAALRKAEAELIMQWTAKAREVEPRGQVLIDEGADLSLIGLEPMDVVRVPKRSAIVMVHGDVVSPIASSFKEDRTVLEYIELAGGFNQTEDKSKILLVSPDGRFKSLSGWELKRHRVSPGDEILVLPEVASKSLQVSKDLTQVIYQIAVSAGTVLKLVL